MKSIFNVWRIGKKNCLSQSYQNFDIVIFNLKK